MKTYILTNGSTVKDHISFKKNGIRIQCDTENFVPIVVLDLSTSSSSSSHSSTSMTRSRQECTHPTSSSSSSTSPTTTVSSDSETREKENLSGKNSYPTLVSSSSHFERTERDDPWTKPTKIQNQIIKKITAQNGRPVICRYPGVAARNQGKFGG